VARGSPQRYVFLDPDGTQQLGLVIIVAAKTGVWYAHQCGGYSTEERDIKGFAVPLGAVSAEQPLISFFRDTFHGNPPALDRDLEADAGGQWSADALDVLAALVGAILFWKTYPRTSGYEDERTFLELDRSRLRELTEAWVPVRTVYGPGVLIFANSD
jgi:hypothetical protein